jgi:hypothetical protein
LVSFPIRRAGGDQLSGRESHRDDDDEGFDPTDDDGAAAAAELNDEGKAGIGL